MTDTTDHDPWKQHRRTSGVGILFIVAGALTATVMPLAEHGPLATAVAVLLVAIGWVVLTRSVVRLTREVIGGEGQ